MAPAASAPEPNTTCGLTTRQLAVTTCIIAMILLFSFMTQTTPISKSIKDQQRELLGDSKANVDDEKKPSSAPAKPTSPPPPKFQSKRYEPNIFDADREFMFNPTHTPLTLIDELNANASNSERTKALLQLPKNWDGGYGWMFVKYHASKFEDDWQREAALIDTQPGSPLCNLLITNFSREMNVYIQHLPRMVPDNGDAWPKCEKKDDFPDEPMVFPDDVFSKYEYVFGCTKPPCRSPPPTTGAKIGDKKFTYIEPLVGLVRHINVCQNHAFLVNKNYMIVDAWSLTRVSRSTISPEPKVMYFDAGASLWNSGAGGASMNWFSAIYDALCLPFTDWFMWEAAKHDPQHVFNLLPGRIKPNYRWFNIYLQTAANSWDNPNNHLLKQARKEDIVIFKIDFDSPSVEMALIDQILKYREISDLIDELFFEHHVNMELLRNHWGTGADPVYQKDSIKMFKKLRERGIRAHSWV
jgi:hypothetical protein